MYGNNVPVDFAGCMLFGQNEPFDRIQSRVHTSNQLLARACGRRVSIALGDDGLSFDICNSYLQVLGTSIPCEIVVDVSVGGHQIWLAVALYGSSLRSAECADIQKRT